MKGGKARNAKKIKTNTVKNGVVFIICYAPNEDKARPFEVARAFTDEGFHHIDNIVIEKSYETLFHCLRFRIIIQ